MFAGNISQCAPPDIRRKALRFSALRAARDNPREYAKPKVGENRLRFEQEPLMSIRIDNNILSATELDFSGKRFLTSTVHFSSVVDPVDHDRGQDWRVGCLDGAYIARSVYSSGSNEGSGKSRSWREKRIRKLPDGNLQVHTTISCSYAQFGKPRCGSYPMIFPAYNGNLEGVLNE